MFALRRHKLLARLLGALQQQVQDTHGGSAVLMLREVWELVARRDTPQYAPLLLYRMVGVAAARARAHACEPMPGSAGHCLNVALLGTV